MISLKKDGDKWIALIGSNLHVGLVGKGDTKQEAAEDLMETVHKLISMMLMKSGTNGEWPEEDGEDV